MKFANDTIVDFLEDFSTFRRDSEAERLSTDDFERALRVFYWFNHDNEFKDVRSVCEKYKRLFREGNKDPYIQDLHELLVAYTNTGNLEKTWAYNFDNDLTFIVPVYASTHKRQLEEKGVGIDPSLYNEFCSVFHALDAARERVLNYISEEGLNHLKALSICKEFVLLDVIAIFYNLTSSYEEKSEKEQKQVYEFIKEIQKVRSIDLTLGPKWQVEALQYFIEEYETAEDK